MKKKIITSQNKIVYLLFVVLLCSSKISAQTAPSGYVEATEWIDHTPINDKQADGTVYIKKANTFYVLQEITKGQPLNVVSFGVKPDGKTDSSLPLQKAIDFAVKTGWSIELPIGTIVTSKKILVDLSMAKTDRKIKIKGAGRNLTIIHNIGSETDIALHVKGNMKQVDYFNIEGFSMKRTDVGKPDGGTALKLENLLNVSVKDIDTFRFKTGFEFTDVCAGYFDNLVATWGDYGLINKKTTNGFTYPNLLNYVNCSFLANTTRGAYIEYGHNVKFDSCGFEGNYGTGLEMSYNGLNGSVSANVINCYFENNINNADVILTVGNGGSANFIGNTFNRFDNKTENNIIVNVTSDKKSKLNMIGNGFMDAGKFTPSNDRSSIKIMGKKQNLDVDDRNYYK